MQTTHVMQGTFTNARSHTRNHRLSLKYRNCILKITVTNKKINELEISICAEKSGSNTEYSIPIINQVELGLCHA